MRAQESRRRSVDGKVYVGTGDCRVVAIDAGLAWAIPIDSHMGLSVEPIVVDGVIYLGPLSTLCTQLMAPLEKALAIRSSHPHQRSLAQLL